MRIRQIIHIVLSVISVIDIIVSLSMNRGLIVSKFIRVVRITISIRPLRRALNRILLVIYDSSQILLFLFGYVLISGYIAFRLFRGTQQGFQYFNTKLDSTWNLLVFITTANSPDIVLPAYKMGTTFVLFFVFFIIFGLFFLMNLLLAIFTSNYRSRVEESLIKFESVRNAYLENKFKEYGGEKGYLTKQE
jgi:two pore calcium channel protein 3